jgi:hypothetical protein
VVTVDNFTGTDAELANDDREERQPSAAVHARVITFHVDSERVEEMKDSMNKALMRFQRHPDFRGLVCLERGEDRHEVVAITLWAGSGLEETEHDAERTRKRIAATTDLGVSTKTYNVFGTTPEP